MDLVIAPSSLPIRWKDIDYQVVKAGIASGVPYAEVKPKNSELEAAIEHNLRVFGAIRVLWKSGYLELSD